jgi:hypothetical protein
MDDRQIKAGLADLAEDVGPLHVDIDDVIARAAGVGRRRRTIAAAGIGTVTALAALGVVGATVGFGPHGDGQSVAAAGATPSPTTSPASRTIPIPESTPHSLYDAEAAKLTGQFYAVQSRVIPSSFSVTGYQGTGLPSPGPMVFIRDQQGGPPQYMANATLTDSQGKGNFAVYVAHRPVGGNFGCPVPSQRATNCSFNTLRDGTKVVTYDDVEGSTISTNMEVSRPDDTLITALSDITPGAQGARQAPPLTTAQLAKLAQAFTY